jgi:uncharacterized membrane protein YphA (DoxX/SURF4 family)
MAEGDSEKRLASLILRAFLAQFWLLQFFGKIRDQESGVVAWKNLGIWSSHLSDHFAKTTPLPDWSVVPFTRLVPYAELILGLMFLFGFQQRLALAAASLLIVALDVGLMMQLAHDDVARNTIFLAVMLLGLQWERFGRVLSIDALLAARKAGKP